MTKLLGDTWTALSAGEQAQSISTVANYRLTFELRIKGTTDFSTAHNWFNVMMIGASDT